MKTILGLVAALIATTAAAEIQTIDIPIKCASKEFFIKRLIREFGELPQWIGRKPGSKLETALLLNPKTGTWTVIIMQEDTICAVTDGEGYSVPVDKNPAVGSKISH